MANEKLPPFKGISDNERADFETLVKAIRETRKGVRVEQMEAYAKDSRRVILICVTTPETGTVIFAEQAGEDGAEEYDVAVPVHKDEAN